jgi:4-amino-4-deoxy-L-arabinose transferase-like glycosyltransferase
MLMARDLTLPIAILLMHALTAPVAGQWVVITGEPTAISLADPEVEPLLGEGFRARVAIDGVARIWCQRQASLALPLGSDSRSVVLDVVVARPGTTVGAWLDGIALGERIPEAAPLTWDVPTGTAAGLHHFELRSRPPPNERSLPPKRVLALASLEIHGAAGGQVRSAALPVTLGPGDQLVAAVDVTLRTRVATTSDRDLVATLVGPGVRTIGPWVWSAAQPQRGFLTITPTSPGATTVEAVTVAPPLDGWHRRLTCRLPIVELAVVLVLAVLAWTLRHRIANTFGPPATPRNLITDLILVFLVALGLRLWWVHTYGQVPLNRLGDEIEYLVRSRHLATGEDGFWTSLRWHGWQSWSRAPGFYALLAAFDIRTATRPNLYLIQALLGAVAAAATALASRSLFGRRAGLVAGLLIALNLELIATSNWVMSEPLALATTCLAFAALLAAVERPHWLRGSLAGLAWGVATLVRSAGLSFLPLAAVALLLAPQGARRNRWAAAAGLLIGFMAVVAPWSVRTSRLTGHLVLVDTVATANLLQYHPTTGFVASADLDLSRRADAETYYHRVQAANHDQVMVPRGGEIKRAVLRQLAADPAHAARRTWDNLLEHFAPFEDFYLERLAPEPRWCQLALWTDLMNAGYLAILVPGVLGLVAFARDRRTWALLAWLVLMTGVVVVLFKPDFIPGRYRQPICRCWRSSLVVY